MSHSIIGPVTKYLADLTTKLSQYVKAENPATIDLLQDDDTISTQNHPKLKYKKPDEWNYLQYLQHLLKLSSTYKIQLESRTEPFSIKQDLQIMIAVSSNPDKIIIKAIEQLSKAKNTYHKNYRNQLVKRSFNQLKERHKFLKTNIMESQLKYLISWLETKGLQKKAYIQVSSAEDFKKTGSNIFISKESLSGIEKIVNKLVQKRIEPVQGKNEKDDRSEENEESQENQDEEMWQIKTGRKRVHRDCQTSASLDVNRIFQTPPAKLSNPNEPQAPKKVKQEDSPTESIFETPIKQKRTIRIIDSKKDVIIKSDFKYQSANKKAIKIQTQPIVSDFQHQLTPNKQEPPKSGSKSISKRSSQVEKSEHNSKQGQRIILENLLNEFEKKLNYPKHMILKFLDEVSGDLDDLKEYLQKQDKKLLWKRMEDAVLRKFVKQYPNILHKNYKHKQAKVSGTQVTQIQSMHDDLVKTKGLERIKKRVRYLELIVENSKK